MFETNSPDETQAIAKQIASQAQPGDIYLLNGEMGAGKTAFSKGFAQGLGINQHITSPTFTILNIYEEGRLPLYHFDLYRVEDDIHDQGFEDYFFGKGVCLIEWGQYAMDIIGQGEYHTIDITKDLSQGENYRQIQMTHLLPLFINTTD